MGAWQSCQHVRICSTRNEIKVPSCSTLGVAVNYARPASSSRKTSGWRPKQYISATARGHERLYRGRASGYRCRGDPALLAPGRSNAYHPIRDPKRARPRFACCAFSQSNASARGADDVRAITRTGGPVGRCRASPGYGGAIRDSRPRHEIRPGDTFPVTIEVQALRGIRQLAFSVTYKKSILQLVNRRPVRSRSKAARTRSSRR